MITAFIIVATSHDGFIAKDASQLSTKWASKEDTARFVELTKRAGVVIMGSTTFETLPKPLKGRLNIVYSRKKQYTSDDPERPVETTTDEPSVLLEKLAAKGYKEVAICGGAQIYTAFMKAGLVSKVYLTIEPIELGNGIRMMTNGLVMESMSTWIKVSEQRLPTGTTFYEYSVPHSD